MSFDPQAWLVEARAPIGEVPVLSICSAAQPQEKNA